MAVENLGTENEDIREDSKEEKTEIEKREEEATERGEIEFEDPKEEEIVADVEPDTVVEPVSQPIVIDGTEYTTDQLREILAKKSEPKVEEKPEAKSKFAELKERVKGDEELTELVSILEQNTAELNKVSDLKRELEQRGQSEAARAELRASREKASKHFGYEMPDIDDPSVKTFFTKELQTLDPYIIYGLMHPQEKKSSKYIPPNLEDQSEGRGQGSEVLDQIERNAKLLGAKNPKNAVKNYKG